MTDDAATREMNPTRSAKRRQPKQARSRAKVEAILSAARKLLTAEGPEALNTNRIAKEAGVGVGSVYEYFGNKEGIARELITRLSDEETDRVRRRIDAIAVGDLEGAITAAVEEAFALYSKNHALYRSLWAMTAIARTVGDKANERALMQYIEGRFAALGIPNAELRAFTVFHIVESLALRFAQSNRFDIEVGVRETTHLVRAYLHSLETQ